MSNQPRKYQMPEYVDLRIRRQAGRDSVSYSLTTRRQTARGLSGHILVNADFRVADCESREWSPQELVYVVSSLILPDGASILYTPVLDE